MKAEKAQNPFAVATGYFFNGRIQVKNYLKEHTLIVLMRMNSIVQQGELFLTQLFYLIGKRQLIKSIIAISNSSILRQMILKELLRVSGANLDWYLTDWDKTQTPLITELK
jgi:hypothetical protein